MDFSRKEFGRMDLIKRNLVEFNLNRTLEERNLVESYFEANRTLVEWTLVEYTCQ
jgi:hypothetical protein